MLIGRNSGPNMMLTSMCTTESIRRRPLYDANITRSEMMNDGIVYVDFLSQYSTIDDALSPGQCAMRVKICDDKNSMERRRFRMKVEAAGRPDIEPAITEKLTVV